MTPTQLILSAAISIGTISGTTWKAYDYVTEKYATKEDVQVVENLTMDSLYDYRIQQLRLEGRSLKRENDRSYIDAIDKAINNERIKDIEEELQDLKDARDKLKDIG